MTARLATHPDVASRTSEVLDRLSAAGIEVEFVEGGADPLHDVRDAKLDLALVGIRALRGSAADGLTTVAVLPRGEFRDVLVSLSGAPMPLADLPEGARVGVVGQRCLAFLRAHRPEVEPVVLESVAMIGELQLDAAVLGSFEARQAGLGEATAETLEPKAWLPEPGRGALALIARHPIAEATALDHLPTRTALRAELSLLDALDASADATLGALAQPSGRSIRLWAAAASPDGRRLVRSDLTGPLDEPEALGMAVARQLTERGIGLVIAESAP